MIFFILRKILYAISVLIGVITTTFVITYVLPGDPARLMLGQRADPESVASLRRQLGLDLPLWKQYGNYIVKLTQGDMGRSFSTNRDVMASILERFPATALLSLSAMALSTVIGILLGIIAAARPNSWLDTTLMSTALLGISLPSFVVGTMFLLLFGVTLRWTPISGYIDTGWNHLILPMITLALRPLSVIARVTRSSMIEALSQDYIRTARAKGASISTILLHHALRNALNPVITTISSWLAGLLAGTVFIEYIFNWPGIGMVALDAILKLDYPMIQGTVQFTAIIFVLVNLIVDITYAFLDPKVKLS